MFTLVGKHTTAKVMIDSVEPQCVAQITEFINHKAFSNPVAIMPDTHAGKGSVVGFTMPMTPLIIPNVIGVDIGCSVEAWCLGPVKNLTLHMGGIDHQIRQRVPFGFDIHERPLLPLKEYKWAQVRNQAQAFAVAYQNRFGVHVPPPPQYDIEWFMKKCNDTGCDPKRGINSLGTLGGGNHFVEFGVDLQDNLWIIVHTGSRNFGKAVCEYWQGLAIKNFTRRSKDDRKEEIKKLKATYNGKELYDRIKAYKASPEPAPSYPCSDDLRWLEGDQALMYLYDMVFAQHYAETNRKLILKQVHDVVGGQLEDVIETTHNFIDFNDFVVRKGAVCSYTGERLLIPFNMRDGMLVCEGKSNPDWNFSAPHGAGRTMSRSQAKKNITLDTFREQMKDVYSTSVVTDTLDEAPDAYKPMEMIEEAIAPTAKIVDRIKPILNMKSCG